MEKTTEERRRSLVSASFSTSSGGTRKQQAKDMHRDLDEVGTSFPACPRTHKYVGMLANKDILVRRGPIRERASRPPVRRHVAWQPPALGRAEMQSAPGFQAEGCALPRTLGAQLSADARVLLPAPPAVARRHLVHRPASSDAMPVRRRVSEPSNHVRDWVGVGRL